MPFAIAGVLPFSSREPLVDTFVSKFSFFFLHNHYSTNKPPRFTIQTRTRANLPLCFSALLSVYLSICTMPALIFYIVLSFALAQHKGAQLVVLRGHGFIYHA